MKQKSTKELIKEVSEYKGATPVIRELTPELADKIWKDMEKRIYDDQVSKEKILQCLKQLKAQMGKLKSHHPINGNEGVYNSAIIHCITAIDKKIEKIKAL